MKKGIKYIFIFILIIPIVLIIFYKYIYSSDNKNLDLEDSKVTVSNEDVKIPITHRDNKSIGFPENLFISGKIKGNVFLCNDDKGQDIYGYDIEKKSKTKIGSSSKGYYVKKLISNDNWIVWIEDEQLITNLGNQPYLWRIKAKNLETKEEILIDKSNFSNNKYDIPSFLRYTPEYIDISPENKVVYGKMDLDGDNIINKVMYFDIDNKKLTSIKEIENIQENYIEGVSTDKNLIVWAEAFNYDKTMKLSTQFKDGKIYSYNIDSKEEKSLTKDGYYARPIINEDMIVADKVLNTEGAAKSDIVLIDIKDNKIKTIVDKNSSIYHGDNKGSGEALHFPVSINNRYMTWSSLLYNRYIYDVKEKVFIDLLPKDDNYKRIAKINYMVDNYVFMAVEDKKGDTRNLCAILNDK